VKQCTGPCRQVLPLSEFSGCSWSLDGLQYACKKCKAAYQRQYRKVDATMNDEVAGEQETLFPIRQDRLEATLRSGTRKLSSGGSEVFSHSPESECSELFSSSSFSWAGAISEKFLRLGNKNSNNENQTAHIPRLGF